MAPRRGGGGGGGGSSVSSCPGAFEDLDDKVYFACIVLFLVVFLLISFATCSFRKKSGAGKKLIGGFFLIALLLWILAYALNLVSDVLRECNTVTIDSYVGLSIAINIFYRLAYWALLFIAGYQLNIMLRENLGSPSKIIKIVLLAIMAVMFALSCGLIGVVSYNNWTQTSAGYDADAQFILDAYEQLRVAYAVLLFLSILVTSALSVMTVIAMRAKRICNGDLLAYILALALCMTIWSLIEIVFAAAYLQDSYQILSFETQAALSYAQSFFQAMSFVVLLFIARHASWSQTTTAPAQQDQQVYYAYDANQQPVYYHQAPEYVPPKH